MAERVNKYVWQESSNEYEKNFDIVWLGVSEEDEITTKKVASFRDKRYAMDWVYEQNEELERSK